MGSTNEPPVLAVISGTLQDVLRQARTEALAAGHEFIGPEHMLLALTALDADLFAHAGVAPQELRERLLARRKQPGPASSRVGDLPFTSKARKVIELAAREAQAMGRTVSAADVLIGIAAEQENAGAAVLRELGLTAAVLRGRAGNEVADGLLHLKIDESSERSIFEQIVGGVQEAVATGRLKPGERLPSVRRLADRLDVAPGTVARAYGELERMGVVATDGARGTRVAERPAPVSDPNRSAVLDGMMRPVAIAAFHLGATAAELREALDRATRDILPDAGAA